MESAGSATTVWTLFDLAAFYLALNCGDCRIADSNLCQGTVITDCRNAAEFHVPEGPSADTETEVFVTAMMNPLVNVNPAGLFRVFVRLPPGVAPEPVRDRLNAVLRALDQEDRKDFPYRKDQRISIEPAGAGVSRMQKDYGQALAALGDTSVKPFSSAYSARVANRPRCASRIRLSTESSMLRAGSDFAGHIARPLRCAFRHT